MTVMKSAGQYQVVIGDKVDDIYNLIIPLLERRTSDLEKATENSSKDKSIWNSIVNFISSLFMPVLGVLAASGVLRGTLILLTSTKLMSETSGTYMILFAAANSMFYFMPIILGFSAANTFKVNPYLGATIGGAIEYPTLIAAFAAGKSINFLNIPVILMNYSQTLVPIIAAIWLLSLIIKVLKRIIPKSLQFIFVPLFSLVIVIPVTFIVIGPLVTLLSNQLANSILWLYGIAPVISGFILGGIWQLVVVVGLHWAFITIAINNIASKGFDPILPLTFCTVFGQVGASLALALKSKDHKFRELSFAATLSGFFGITEPILYGVTIPHKKAFIVGSVGSAIGGAITGLAGSKVFIPGGIGGIFGFPGFLNPKSGADAGFVGIVISSIVAFGIALILGLLFVKGVESKNSEYSAEKVPQLVSNLKDGNVVSPVDGEIRPLEKINDDLFSSGALGKGVAIYPHKGKIYAPFDGEVVSVFPTQHAIGLRSDSGVELLIHIGLDTVNLNGKYFEAKVKNSQRIRQGDLLEEFNKKAIEEEGFDLIIPVIITNSDLFSEIHIRRTSGVVSSGEDIIESHVQAKKNKNPITQVI
ncbi:phosphoenolpyruvate-dependent sugar phosphotransferase system EIIABC, beta-glucoside-specific [Liquorilactobacillus sucicola DSM 21376 = JCM 15457]|uniref:Phosphoenolpyruvate-dependent sugar phosphotransferase system EIIABC, beta-glucoside-specific n=2 Tax=Liquorilactobacillus sucicola TaxID=519050 RepID=A0A0R2E057_9LACO|nr:phosphoenolpyruvate-dependent sugar phosphotransferase system EIIABC, beta-glucoside-specific [Liquorilactobacillus sucicola DSM 21376 = JCM 15457]